MAVSCISPMYLNNVFVYCFLFDAAGVPCCKRNYDVTTHTRSVSANMSMVESAKQEKIEI